MFQPSTIYIFMELSHYLFNISLIVWDFVKPVKERFLFISYHLLFLNISGNPIYDIDYAYRRFSMHEIEYYQFRGTETDHNMSSEVTSIPIGGAYLKTVQGICKILEIVFDIIGLGLVVTDFAGYVINIFRSAAVFSIVDAALSCSLHMFDIPVRRRTEILWHIIVSVLYICAIVFLIIDGRKYDELMGGAAMGVLSVITRFVDAGDFIWRTRSTYLPLD